MDVDDDLLREVVREAQRASLRLEGHEIVCTERLQSLRQTVEEIKTVIQVQGKELRELVMAQNTIVHGRLNTMSDRMFWLLISALGGAIVGLGSLCFYLITKGKL